MLEKPVAGYLAVERNKGLSTKNSRGVSVLQDEAENFLAGGKCDLFVNRRPKHPLPPTPHPCPPGQIYPWVLLHPCPLPAAFLLPRFFPFIFALFFAYDKKKHAKRRSRIRAHASSTRTGCARS